MKRRYISYFLLMTAAVGAATPAEAAAIYGGEKGSVIVDVNDIVRVANDLAVSMNVDLSGARLESNREVEYTPFIASGADTLRMEPFTLAGKGRYYFDIRNPETMPANLYRSGKDAALVPFEYTAVVPWMPWMEQAMVGVEARARGCTNCPKGEWDYALAETDFIPPAYEAEFVYVTPVAEAVKTREVSGRAFIDFKVNQTVILPDYRRNAVELAKIIATIDSVKNDKDITVTSLSISGTASPEGSYSNNVRLAKGRTEALTEYVRRLNNFPKGFIRESYEPVDWKGLSEWLRSNTIENGEAILAIVEGDLAPEQRNNKIRTTYPTQYKWLLENVYPALRHSDYAIEFTIRTYTSVEEIMEVMQTQPQKLSLAELFKAAAAQPEGSELYTEAFEIAVRMYPEDPAANLNAGIAAIKRGDYARAKKYLAKAGSGDEVRYQLAVVDALEGNTEEALEAFMALTGSSNPSVSGQAASAVEQLNAILNYTPWRKL